jgi:hypothetical protein
VDQRRGWGQMDVRTMMAHVCRIRLHWLIINVAPWPKGAPTAPGFLVGPAQNVISGITVLPTTMRPFAASTDHKPHPAFGRLFRKDWGCLTWRHMDHLRQFSV